MSKAGIHSNRGDGYQTLVALDWALTVLSNPEYEWLEIDSVKWSVDDVVVGKGDGTIICCQCKKNQPAHKAWAISDLADELHKAASLLASNRKVKVRFYSRNNFGELASLREYGTTYADESEYQANLGVGHRQTDDKLAEQLRQQAPNLSSYEFLCRTIFETTPDLGRMATLLHERLQQLVSNPAAANNALWTCLDQLGMRVNGDGQSVAIRHRLSKDDLKALIGEAGAMLTPTMNVAEVRATFKSTSAIGRTWCRDIGNERITRPVIDEILAAIAAKECSILLTGMPGSGKTCVMIALQEELEKLAQTVSTLLPLFIQSREFADLATAADRQAQGLSAQWVEQVARMAEGTQVVVVIDSLDVLSIAREHGVLDYFLAQIDRLLQISNVTVITACRDFDRRYDRRIAQRKWSKEFTCQPLDWDAEVVPLLAKLDIDASATDSATRELICNPRELALFVELAQQSGSFNVVTSQALAQRYLSTIVQANSALGIPAMQAIEAIAAEMLKSRRLAVPHQRFDASQEILRALLSHNILHKTQDEQLTFGHQTLLDVLVISGAMRRGVTLNAFIQELPPVPFVRPSIRSFVAQLAAGDRREFRKQLRTVFMGNNAFHIRRLVAECLAEMVPQADDWPLLRDLRNTHQDVFQVVYTHAIRVEWHYFWLMHLVPILKDMRDAEGLTMHVYRASQWKNDDAAGVLAFWTEVLGLDWVDKTVIVGQLEAALSDVHQRHATLFAPLLLSLLKLPRQERSLLGRALARCVTAGGVDDAVLWRYIVGDVSDEDVLAYHFDKKLRCGPYELDHRNEKFLAERMRQSTALLDLAVATLERWGQLRRSRYGEAPTSYGSGFLRAPSYGDVHSEVGHRYVDGERMLLNAIEAAVVQHAADDSDWWRSSRDRLCCSAEGALRYFAILACTAAPIPNLEVVSRMLGDKALLESDLSYEMGTLIEKTFLHLDAAGQDAVQATILTLHQEATTDLRHHRPWMLHKQAQLLVTIPCHLRTPAAQAVFGESEKTIWPLIRQPNIGVRGGMVGAPFSFEVFLAASDAAVLRLLAHYNGYVSSSDDDFLIGGEREVGAKLREAASLNPTRFLMFLSANWVCIAEQFCDEIMEGVATYLAHRYGNLRPNGIWLPIEDPNAATLARQILDELERHPAHWHQHRAASSALQACAYVVQDAQDVERLVFLAAGFSTLREDSSVWGDAGDLITAGINMARGHIAEALMIVASQLAQSSGSWPELITPMLHRFAADDNPAIRALLLRRFPYLQSQHFELGWELFTLAMQESTTGLWAEAEPCLYYAYHQQFEVIAPWLERLYREGRGQDLTVWGRVSALAALAKRQDFSNFLVQLKELGSTEAWQGAASVWTHPENLQHQREECLTGLEAGLNAASQHASVVARECCSLFQEVKPLVSMPTALLQRCFLLFEEEVEPVRHHFYRFSAWVNAISINDSMQALEVIEIYFHFVQSKKTYVHDHNGDLTQLLTRLFAQAEEQEELDSGAMLKRVVAVQDTLLTLGVNEVNEWLKAAERAPR